ncbi:MAG: MoxR family ATPase [Lentisphaeraceae bacterium]|nr:MoxR family ATPase [Lentisphaeraceae bacterium]
MDTMTPEKAGELYQSIRTQLSQVIVGQEQIIKLLMVSLFSKGHCLLVGVPGLAKTLLVKSISEVIGMDFNRVQFTPDLMPSDIIGSEIIRDQAGKLTFEYQEGPIFTNLLLADEINRTPPKTQAALLEAMQEKRVTVGGKTRTLSEPFLVVATQNPIEQEGTYPLPEAQLDRFMLCLNVGYPSIEEEREIVKSTTGNKQVKLESQLDASQILGIQNLVRDIPVTDHIINYAVDLASATRPDSANACQAAKEYIEWGVGPRASQFLILGAKTIALLDGRVSPETKDVREIAMAVLQHRLVVNYKATGKGLDSAAVTKLVIDQVQEEVYA